MRALVLVEPGALHDREGLVAELASSRSAELVCAIGLPDLFDYAWLEKYTKHIVRFSYRANDLREQLLRFQSEAGAEIQGMLTYFEPALDYVNEAAHTLRLPVISHFRDRSIRHKGIARNKLARVTDAQPWYRVVSDEEALKELMREELPFPLVVKPADMCDGLAVTRVENKMQLKAAFLRARRADRWDVPLRGRIPDLSSDVLVEELIEGPEYTAHVVVQHGKTSLLGVSSRQHFSADRLETTGVVFPAVIPTPLLNRIEDLTRKTHAGLMLANTFTSVDLRMKGTKPIIIEVNCRMSGPCFDLLFRRAYRAKLGRLAADLHMGNPVAFRPPEESKRQELHFLTTTEKGRFLDLPRSKRFGWNTTSAFAWYPGKGTVLHAESPDDPLRIGRVVHAAGRAPSLPEMPRPFPALAADRIAENDMCLVFPAIERDIARLSLIESARWAAGGAAPETVLAERFRLNPAGTLVAFSTKRRRIIGFANLVPFVDSPARPLHGWEYFAALALSPDHFADPRAFNAQLLLNLSLAPEAPPETAALLIRGASESCRRQGHRKLRYGITSPNYHRMAKLGISFKEYYEGLLSRKYHEDPYRLALISGGAPKGFIKNYREDPPSLNYGIIIEHDLDRGEAPEAPADR